MGADGYAERHRRQRVPIMSLDCFCDGEPPEFYRAAMVHKPRAQHKCDECRGVIPIGEPHERVAAKLDGHFMTYRTCSRCLAIREYVTAHVPCFCWAHGSLLEDARNTVDAYWPQAPGLFFGYGRLAVKQRRAANQNNAAKRISK